MKPRKIFTLVFATIYILVFQLFINATYAASKRIINIAPKEYKPSKFFEEVYLEKKVQDKYYTKIDTNTVKIYHKLVFQAENFICKTKYDSSIIYYERAFNLSVKPFAQDIYNIAICYIKTNRMQESMKYCYLLVEKGCSLSFFEKSTFKELRKQTIYWNELVKEFPKRRGNFIRSVDTLLITSINKMVIADQNFFCERPKRLTNNVFLDSLFTNDRHLSQTLSVYFSKHGYLTEDLIGANFVDTTLSVYPIFNVLIRHHYQLKEYDLTSLLRTAVLKGLLKPDIFCSWYTFEKKPIGYGEDFFITKYDCNFYEATYTSIKQKIEKNRSTMWLPTLQELKEKIIQTHCSYNKSFLFYSPIAILPNKMDTMSEETFLLFNTKLPFTVIDCNK